MFGWLRLFNPWRTRRLERALAQTDAYLIPIHVRTKRDRAVHIYHEEVVSLRTRIRTALGLPLKGFGYDRDR
jgi:hypothetical protein